MILRKGYGQFGGGPELSVYRKNLRIFVYLLYHFFMLKGPLVVRLQFEDGVKAVAGLLVIF